MPIDTQFVDPGVEATRPNEDTGYYTIADYRWVLQRFTSPRWTVEETTFADPEAPIAFQPLKATLRHQRGAAIFCSPKRPFRNRDWHKSVHRVRLSPASGAVEVAFVDPTDAPSEFHAQSGEPADDDSVQMPWETFAGASSHPFSALDNVLKTARRTRVREIESDRRLNCVKPIPLAVCTMLGLAIRVSRQVQAQPTLTAFAAD